MKRALGAILLCCLVFNSYAQHTELEQSAEEVFWAELVYPQERGELQIAISPWINTSTNFGQTPFVVEYGLSDTWQLEAEWSGPGYKSESSLFEFGTKYTFLNLFDRGVHLALGNEIEIPISTSGVATETFFVLAKDFSKFGNFHLFTQGALEFEISEADDSLEKEALGWSWHIGALFPGERLHFSAEVSWRHEDDLHTYLTPGLIWEILGGFQIGVGIPIGLSDSADTFRIASFLTYEFELFEDD